MGEGAIPLNAARMLNRQREGRTLREALYRAGRAVSRPLRAVWEAHKPASSRVERLREGGFFEVWEHIGDRLARENGRLDSYLSSHLAPMSNIWTRLKTMQDCVRDARTILDVTAMNGMMANHLLETAGERELTVYVNEISERMRHKLRTKLSRHISTRGRINAVPVCLDMSAAETPQMASNFDVVLWWGSFQMLAGRYNAIGNAFDMLREGGCFVLMDVYPYDEARLLRHGFGNATVRQIAFVSKPLDMGSDVKGLILKAWLDRMGRGGRIHAIPTVEELDQPLVESARQQFARMRCIYAIKPRSRAPTGTGRPVGGRDASAGTGRGGPEAARQPAHVPETVRENQLAQA